MSQPTDPSPVEASDPAEQPVGPAPISASAAAAAHPRFLFFGVVSAVSLLADVATKAWAEVALGVRAGLEPSIVLVKEHLTLTLAYNKGGAWGLFSDSSETLRRPFFLLVSVLAIAFIVSLYSRLTPGQHALKWGLPLVLGGALGNLQDRIVRSSVIDFIDYRAEWVRSMNKLFARVSSHWNITDHWPTYNVADICICIGVGLMAVDMLTSRRPHAPTPGQAA
jgi:signal peptidase II